MKRLIIILLLTFFCNHIYSQDNIGLNLGQKMPDLILKDFLRDDALELKISDLNGKLIIFDFWNVRCVNCIVSMPYMDSLQKKFNDQIQIIYVTKDSRNEVIDLFSRLNMPIPDVPFIIGDTILNQLFPHYGDPFHVWVNKEGIVQAITFEYSTNFETIEKFLDGIDPLLSRRNDFGINLNFPLVSEQNSSILSEAKSYSIFFKGLNEYSMANDFVKKEKDSVTGTISMIKLINASLTRLYNVAFNKDIFGIEMDVFNLAKNNRIIIEAKDLMAFDVPKDKTKMSDWYKNTYSYEIKFLNSKEKDIYKIMQEDLNKNLPYAAAIEKRKVNCLLLQKVGNTDKLKIENYNIKPLIDYNDNKTVSIINKPVNILIQQLIYWNTAIEYPIVDETNISENINLQIPVVYNNISKLNSELIKYGLGLVKGEREINILRITDANGN